MSSPSDRLCIELTFRPPKVFSLRRVRPFGPNRATCSVARTEARKRLASYGRTSPAAADGYNSYWKSGSAAETTTDVASKRICKGKAQPKR
jgi:hypothetical protein